MSVVQESPERKELPERLPPYPPRFQFGISTLFLLTNVTAILCAVLFAMPGRIAIPIMLIVTVAVLPAVWTTVIVYGRGYQRTFGIGALFPSAIPLFYGFFSVDRVIPLFSFGNGVGENTEFRIVLFALWLLCPLVGVICMGVRYFLERGALSTCLPNPFHDSTDRINGE